MTIRSPRAVNGERMRVNILGPVELIDDRGALVALPADATRLLGRLAVSGRAAHLPDAAGLDAVETLRQHLGERLDVTPDGTGLRLGPLDMVDADRFTMLCTKARATVGGDRRALLAEATGLWNGRALEGMSHEPLVAPGAARLEALRVVAVEDLADALIETGQPDDAAALMDMHTAANPHRERPVELLMRAHIAAGRHAAAIDCYDQFGRRLRDDLGQEPTSGLRALETEAVGGLDPVRNTGDLDEGPLPDGTVTFLFTDIENSTQRWQRDPREMSELLAAHDRTLRAAVEGHGGIVFKHTGDGMCSVFTSAAGAVAAALGAQQSLRLPVRMGVHTGEAERRERDYFGPTLNRAARVMDAGHGGQVLLSATTATLVRDEELVDLGEYHLKGLDIVERIFQIGNSDFPPLRVPRQAPGNLPTDLTTFIGREEEVKRVADELTRHRLVTLIGVGGTGKTRLAMETAYSISPVFPDGCWLIDLAAVNLESGVGFAFASGVGLAAPADQDIVDHVVASLRHKHMLLLIDNCEHLLGVTADVVERILAACPGLVLLATSREPLMLRGEQLVPVPSLGALEAERLFLERARAEAPDLAMDTDQMTAIGELCRRLDGLPLAIELAASRVRAFTPIELVANLEERFRLLVGGRRSKLERHQTMRGTLDWSYELCNELQRALFDRLSVFPAAFDLRAARAVAAGEGLDELDVVDAVPQLVDRSLLQRTSAGDGTTRYRMLETMRAYGREHLLHAARSDEVRERHARFIAATAAALSLQQVGPDEDAALVRLEEYVPDGVVALEWCIEHSEWELGLRTVLVSTTVNEREGQEQMAVLSASAHAANVPRAMLDELERGDVAARSSETFRDAVERGLRGLREPTAVPADRFYWAPQNDFNDGSFTEAEADELVAGLERYTTAPFVTRWFAGWSTIRALAFNGMLDRAETLLAEFEQFVETLASERATRSVYDLRASICLERGAHDDAAGWYRRIVDSQDGVINSWFSLMAFWKLLACRARSSVPFELTGVELRGPWVCFQEQHLVVLDQLGLAATAGAMERIGNHDLAERLVARGLQHEEFARFIAKPMLLPDLLARGGVAPLEPLEHLIEEVLALADELDRTAGASGAAD